MGTWRQVVASWLGLPFFLSCGPQGGWWPSIMRLRELLHQCGLHFHGCYRVCSAAGCRV